MPINIGRIAAIIGAIIAAVNAIVLAIHQAGLTEGNPQLTGWLLMITSVTALITPFLPRAQGTTPEVVVVEKK